MKEAFLHYVWRTRRFRRDGLRAVSGEPVDVLQFGRYNLGDGPDFSEARVRIGDTVWAGHVEMHLRSSDWHRHRHQFDPAYDNVVLHVVWEDDEPVLNARGVQLPTLVLAELVDADIVARYEQLAAEEHAIPCQSRLADVPELVLSGWTERMTLERLERKTAELHALLTEKRGDWDAAFAHQLARCLGLPENAHAMDRLLRALPLSLLQRYRADQVALEALLLGTAGLLHAEVEYLDEYPRQLAREFEHLARKHALEPMGREAWSFRGLRPASFPTMRLVQFAAVLRAQPRIFDPFLETGDPKLLASLLEHEPHAYWRTHYVPDRAGEPRRKVIGRAAAHAVLINAVAPLVFLYGRLQGRPELERRALDLLEALPPERNRVTRQWREVGIVAESAAESQALLTLRRAYCEPRRCLECAIGHCVLKRGPSPVVGHPATREQAAPEESGSPAQPGREPRRLSDIGVPARVRPARKRRRRVQRRGRRAPAA